MTRSKGRAPQDLRQIKITKSFMKNAHGSVLIEWGNTRVLCTAMYALGVPPFLEDSGKGWLTAEYAMLPGSTPQRKKRSTIKPDGRGTEISRLIGRALRSAFDLSALEGYTINIDCDVIEADGGTRTASITGAYVALQLCITEMLSNKLIDRSPVQSGVAAVSCGIVGDTALLDLNYIEDSSASADVNVVMSHDGGIIEVQGTGEKRPITPDELHTLIEYAIAGIEKIRVIQQEALSK
ncbi:MAG: ribonuclease PH [Clostridia bacterium]|jgi:ribonuclease PH|nr:ribonuclease PH [Clostridia bacterium]MBT7123515.1 ribonuclease PH [Clostridia bacterium]